MLSALAWFLQMTWLQHAWLQGQYRSQEAAAALFCTPFNMLQALIRPRAAVGDIL